MKRAIENKAFGFGQFVQVRPGGGGYRELFAPGTQLKTKGLNFLIQEYTENINLSLFYTSNFDRVECNSNNR